MDVIALAQHGINNATATLGTATSNTHLERIYRLCPEVVFCFDGDEAGRKAAFRAMEAALTSMEDGRQARFLFLPEGEDPDTCVRGGGPEHFQRLQRSLDAVRIANPLSGAEWTRLVDEIVARLEQALEHIDKNRLIAAPDCGLGLLGRDLSVAKLKNMCTAAGML